MRFTPFLAVGVVLMAFPALAQQSGDTVLGSYTCAQQVPCADSAGASAVSSDQWAAYGDACMASAFNYTNPSGYLDETAGLDDSGCLTAKGGVASLGNGLTPRCCVVTLSSGACAMHCDLVK